MKRTVLIALFACRDETKPPPRDAGLSSLTPAMEVQASTAAIARSSTGSATPDAPIAPAPVKAARAAAEAARNEMLATRQRVRAKVRSAEESIASLEEQLRMTGPRNAQRDRLTDVGKARGSLAEANGVHRRCEAAFGGEEWFEIEETWANAAALEESGDDKVAIETYERHAELVREFRPHCEALVPMKGAPKRF